MFGINMLYINIIIFIYQLQTDNRSVLSRENNGEFSEPGRQQITPGDNIWGVFEANFLPIIKFAFDSTGFVVDTRIIYDNNIRDLLTVPDPSAQRISQSGLPTAIFLPSSASLIGIC